MNSLWIFFDIIDTVLPGECSYCKKIKIDLFSMTFLWILYDFSMNSLWFCYEFSMILLWILYDFSMNSLWIFFDIIEAVLPRECSYCKKLNIDLGLLHFSTYTIIGCNGNMRYNRLLPNAYINSPTINFAWTYISQIDGKWVAAPQTFLFYFLK